MTLNELGLLHGTDKSLKQHTYDNRTFLDVYERYFSPLKGSEVRFLEIGVLNGSSLKVWSQYFKEGSKIVGLDIDPSKAVFNNNNTKIFIGSQTDKELINQIHEEYPEGFDVILDDGSHINHMILESFDLLFKYVKPGGYYIIEDTHCSYGDKWWGDFKRLAKEWPGMNYNFDSNFENERKDIDNFLLNHIENLDRKNSQIFSIHIYSETIIIEKSLN